MLLVGCAARATSTVARCVRPGRLTPGNGRVRPGYGGDALRAMPSASTLPLSTTDHHCCMAPFGPVGRLTSSKK